MVEKYLWGLKDTIIMTSATLQTNRSFAYLKEQLNAEHVKEVVVDTPFDYKSSTLLYLVNDIPEPADQSAYQQAVERGIYDLCIATEGRALVLFTSYSQLRDTANALGDVLAQHGIALFDQTGGTSKGQMLDAFVQSDKAVLMGTRSFWEGVDVPGADLSVLVIARLPFSVPTDPLFAARSERFEDPFSQYSVPETILRFRQGFGRLIRRKTDRGVVAILDRRILSKRYGQTFLDALPECQVKVGRLVDLPSSAAQWLSAQHKSLH
jgi:DNA polymerase-3 subunit epsilon/ATP-dependent DNA helicase DinG